MRNRISGPHCRHCRALHQLSRSRSPPVTSISDLMLKRIIGWSVENPFIVITLTLFAVVAGMISVARTPLEALPDLSDVQVIVQTEYEGQAPQIVEDQVTYPIASEMRKVPGAETVRGYSFFGVSFVYVILDRKSTRLNSSHSQISYAV